MTEIEYNRATVKVIVIFSYEYKYFSCSYAHTKNFLTLDDVAKGKNAIELASEGEVADVLA